jgi:hypothetical protein
MANERPPQTPSEVADESELSEWRSSGRNRGSDSESVWNLLSRVAHDKPGCPAADIEEQLTAQARFTRKRMGQEAIQDLRDAYVDSSMGSKRALVLWLLAVSQFVAGGLVEYLFHPASHLLGH